MSSRIIRTHPPHSAPATAVARHPTMSSNPLANKSQAWSALFTEPMSELVQRYTASVGFDQRLWRADIQGSLAHAQMLAAQCVISAQDLADIQRGLAQVQAEIESGVFDPRSCARTESRNVASSTLAPGCNTTAATMR